MTCRPRSSRSKWTSGEPYLVPCTRKWSTTEDIRIMQAKKKGNIWEGDHHLYIQYSVPIKLAAFMRKRHLNSNSTAHKSLNYLQNGPDGTSIQTILPETCRWRAEMQWEGLYKPRNSPRKGEAHSAKKKKKTEAYCRRIGINF